MLRILQEVLYGFMRTPKAWTTTEIWWIRWGPLALTPHLPTKPLFKPPSLNQPLTGDGWELNAWERWQIYSQRSHRLVVPEGRFLFLWPSFFEDILKLSSKTLPFCDTLFAARQNGDSTPIRVMEVKVWEYSAKNDPRCKVIRWITLRWN